MPEELPEIGPKQGHAIATDAFMLDLYRLVCMVSADQQVAKYARTSHAIETLQSTFLRTEVTRILISCAAALRIQFDQRPIESPAELKSNCGRLYPVWPADDENVFEVLKLREARNKIIHATDFRFDVMQPYLSDPYRGRRQGAVPASNGLVRAPKRSCLARGRSGSKSSPDLRIEYDGGRR